MKWLWLVTAIWTFGALISFVWPQWTHKIGQALDGVDTNEGGWEQIREKFAKEHTLSSDVTWALIFVICFFWPIVIGDRLYRVIGHWRNRA